MKLNDKQIGILEAISTDGSLVFVSARNKYSQRFLTLGRIDFVQKDGFMLNFNTGVERKVGKYEPISAFFYTSPNIKLFSKSMPEGFFVDDISHASSMDLQMSTQENKKIIFVNDKKTRRIMHRLFTKNLKRLYANFDLRLIKDEQVSFYSQFIGERFKAVSYNQNGKEKVITGVLDSVSRNSDVANSKLCFGYYNGFEFNAFASDPRTMSFEIIKANNISFDVVPIQPKSSQEENSKDMGTIEKYNRQFEKPIVTPEFVEHKRVKNELDIELKQVLANGFPVKNHNVGIDGYEILDDLDIDSECNEEECDCIEDELD